jgi:hypothetical protein
VRVRLYACACVRVRTRVRTRVAVVCVLDAAHREYFAAMLPCFTCWLLGARSVACYQTMSELVNSRCKDCSPKAFQCTACSKNDVTVRKRMNWAKKQEREMQRASVCLLSNTIVVVPVEHDAPEDSDTVGHVYPPMPFPAPLTINNQVLYAPPSIASPLMGTPKSGLNSTPVVPKSANNKASLILPVIVSAVPKSAPKFSPVASCKRAYDDVNSDSEEFKRPKKHDSSSDSDCDTCSSSGSAKKETTKQKMARITKEERQGVCEWIMKVRKDGKMLNGRWIRNGGAKGATMTATSSEVKTSGAYESLAS